MKAGAQEGGDFNETIGLQSLQADAVAEQNEAPIRSMAEMLAVLNLSTLEPFVGGESPLELASLGRQPLLTRLKTLGVAKLGERQNLANGLTKALKTGRLRAPLPSEPAVTTRVEAADLDEVHLAADQHLRVFIMSDVHSDHPSNLVWLKDNLPARREGCLDVLLCPGDVSDDVEILRDTLAMLKERFDEVVFTAGNHDIWVNGPALRRRNKKSILGSAAAAPAAEDAAASDGTSSADGTPTASPVVERRATSTGEGAADELLEPRRDSLEQLALVYEHCAALGVRTAPFWIRYAAGVTGGDAVGTIASADGTPLDVSDAQPPQSPPPQQPPQDVLVVPMQSWYHGSWDQEQDIPSEKSAELMSHLWSDFRHCVWPASFGERAGIDEGLAEHFASMNAPTISRLLKVLPARMDGRPPPWTRLDKPATYQFFGARMEGTPALWDSRAEKIFTRRPVDSFVSARERAQAAALRASKTGRPGSEAAKQSRLREGIFVVSLSHFLPRQELLPEKRALFQPGLHKVSGSVPLERQLRQLMPDMHIFGHTHLAIDATLDGIRYVQWPLGSPKEQTLGSPARLGMLCVYDSAKGGEQPQIWTHWGRHYEEYERDLSKQEVLPYVKKPELTKIISR